MGRMCIVAEISLKLFKDKRQLMALVLALEEAAGIIPGGGVREKGEDLYAYYPQVTSSTTLASVGNDAEIQALLGPHNSAWAIRVAEAELTARKVAAALSTYFPGPIKCVNGADIKIPPVIWLVSFAGHVLEFVPDALPFPPAEPWSPQMSERFHVALGRKPSAPVTDGGPWSEDDVGV